MKAIDLGFHLERQPEPKAKDFPSLMTQHDRVRQNPRTRIVLRLTVFCFFALAFHAHAQGCAQCLDSARATPPQVQAAYRHAIYLLGGAGAALFLVGTLIIGRNR